MYTLLVADDEESMYTGLTTMVDWAGLRLQLVGAYRSGQEVLQALQQRNVDVILTDIRMPGVTGIDIAHYVWEAGLTTRVILLSGYKDFEYAQQAMQYGVRHYLTKPFLMDSLRSVVRDVLADLDDLSQRRTMYHHVVEKYQSIEAFMAQQLFRDAAGGALQREAAYARRVALLELSEACVRRRCLLYELCMAADCAPEDAAEPLRLAAAALGGAECYPVGRTGKGLAAVVVENPPPALDADAMAAALGAAVAELAPVSSVRLMAGYTNLRELASAAPLAGATAPQQRPPTGMGGDDDCRHEVISEALQLIGSGYAENLSLSRVAAQVHLNPVYLSRLFHEQTGRTFSEHLIQVRMQAAARLLESSHQPIYEVCSRVGYTDVKHFYKVFKAATGFTPSEYRERMGSAAAPGRRP